METRKKLREGALCVIRNSSLCRIPVVEGRARLREFLERTPSALERWKVEFLDEPGVLFERTVQLKDLIEEKKGGRLKEP